MDKDTFRFELVDKYSPEVVIEKKLKQIGDATNEYVTGHIEVYDGVIQSYVKENALYSSIKMISDSKLTVDIQESLGEQNTEKNRYEVFLKVKGLDSYKYRMMFVDYSTISYPVTIVLNRELADVYCEKFKDTFIIHTMKQLEELMDNIINSDVLIGIIQSLINESIRREQGAYNA